MQIAKEEITRHKDYQQCLQEYNEFTFKVENELPRFNDLRADLEENNKEIEEHKSQIKRVISEIEKIKDEAADSVTDVMLANQELKQAEVLLGITEDGTDKDLQELRVNRQATKANAKISGNLVETDASIREGDFLDYARKSELSGELEDSLFDDFESNFTELPVSGKRVKTQLPENFTNT